MEKNKSLKKNAIMGILNTVINMIFPLITFMYVSRTLQPTGIGTTQLASTIASYFELFAALGIPLYAVREISKLRDNKEQQDNAASEIFFTNLINTIIMFFAYFLFISIVYKFSITFWIFFIYGLTMVANAFGMEWYFKGQEDFTSITIRNLFVKTVCLLLTFILVKDINDIVVYAILHIASIFLYTTANFVKFNKVSKITFKRFNYLKHIRPAIQVFLITLSTTIYSSLDTVMLGYILKENGEYSVGIYSAAHKIIYALIASITAINSIMLPRLSYYYEQKEYEKIKSILNTCYQIIFLIGLPIVIGCELIPRELITIMSGYEYLEAVTVLRVLAPVVLIVSLTNLIGIQIFYSSGNGKKTIISVALGALCNIILNAILIPKYSYNGAAFGTLLAETIVLIVQLLIGWKLLTFDKFNKNNLKIVIATTIMFLIVTLCQQYINLAWFYNLFIFVAIGGFVYSICLLILKEKYALSTINKIKTIFYRKK